MKIVFSMFTCIFIVNFLAIRDATAQNVDRYPPNWKALEYVATILFFSAVADVKFIQAGMDSYSPQALDSTFDFKNSKPLSGKKGEIEQLVLSSDFMGKHSSISLFFESNLNALQRTQLDSGRKHRFKIYQFLDKGVYSLRLSPTSGQEHLPSSQWSEKGEEQFLYPPKLDLKQPIMDATSLFYVMSAGLFNKPGDHASFVFFVKGQLLVLEFIAKDWAVLEMDYFEQTGKKKAYIEGEQKVLRVILKASPLVASEKSKEFEFIGLKGDLEFYINTKKRLLVQLSGEVDIVGTVDIVLNKVVLN